MPQGGQVALLRFRAAWRWAAALDCTFDLTGLPAGIDRCSAAYRVRVLAGSEVLYDTAMNRSDLPRATSLPGLACLAGFRCLFSPDQRLLALPLGTRAAAGPLTLTLETSFTGLEFFMPTGPRLESAHQLDVALHAAPRLELTQAPVLFRPRDAREQEVAQCATAPDGCRVPLTARLQVPQWNARWDDGWEEWGGPEPGVVPDTPPVATVRFRLEQVSAHAGNSTNYGTGTEPDYAFDPQPGFGTPTATAIATLQPVEQATVRVSSRDYGGTAFVAAEFGLARLGSTVAVEATHLVQWEDWTQAVLPAVCAGVAKRAQLPLDADCDGIADQWEQQYGGNLDPAADVDLGPADALFRGDGYTARDEYRGFHTLERPGPGQTQTVHRRTDPHGSKDVFYYDENGAVTGRMQLLRDNLPFLSFWELPQAAIQNQSPDMLAPNNRNALQARPQYPLYFRNRPLTRPTLGQARLRVSGLPIDIDVEAHGTDVILLQHTIAHEVGHNFGLDHPHRMAPYKSDFPPATSNYTDQGQALNLVIWLDDGSCFPSFRQEFFEQPRARWDDLENNGHSDMSRPLAVQGYEDLWRITLNKPLRSPRTAITVEQMKRQLMSFTRHCSAHPQQFGPEDDFTAAEKGHLCLKESCTQ